MNRIRRFLNDCGEELEKYAVMKEQACSAPEELHLELTFNCNTSCIMCNLRYINKPQDELSITQWVNLINNSKLLENIRFIVLSGGEPWLKDGFIELVKALRAKYPKADILILSNLTDAELALNNIEAIKNEIGLDKMSLGSSLDGIGEAHDIIRGKKGSFDLLSKNLSLIKEKYPGLYFSLNFTLTPENSDQLVPVYDWCAERGYHVSFQLLVQKKETKEFVWEEKHLRTVSEQIDILIGKIAGFDDDPVKNKLGLLTNEGIFSLLLSIHYIERYIRVKKRYFPNCPCGTKYAMIDPYGNLYFCPVHKEMTAGNTAEAGFDLNWTSEKSGEIRKYFNSQACHCWLTCTNGYMLGDAIKSGKEKILNRLFGNRSV